MLGGATTPSPVMRVALLVPLSATHTGVVGPWARPHGFTRSASVSCALPLMSETRSWRV